MDAVLDASRPARRIRRARCTSRRESGSPARAARRGRASPAPSSRATRAETRRGHTPDTPWRDHRACHASACRTRRRNGACDPIRRSATRAPRSRARAPARRRTASAIQRNATRAAATDRRRHRRRRRARHRACRGNAACRRCPALRGRPTSERQAAAFRLVVSANEQAARRETRTRAHPWIADRAARARERILAACARVRAPLRWSLTVGRDASPVAAAIAFADCGGDRRGRGRLLPWVFCRLGSRCVPRPLAFR